MRLWLALHLIIGFPLGIVAANAFEWWFHKHVLHGLGKKKGTFWNFHWYEHHAESRRHDMVDDAYAAPWLGNGINARTKEALALLGGALPWIALLPFVPGFALAALYSSANYYYVHKRAHFDPAWARAHLPWHVDHHLAPNQDANWCVTRPWWDLLRGTREPWIGTDRERADGERRRIRAGRGPAASHEARAAV